jgi:hypothetical protein
MVRQYSYCIARKGHRSYGRALAFPGRRYVTYWKKAYPDWHYSVESGRGTMDQIDKILERDWDAANQRGQETLAAGPLAESAYYDQPTGKVVIELNNGVGLHIPPALIQGIENATPADMAEIVIQGRGLGLHFPRLDADLYVPALARGVLGTSAWMRSLGQKGGVSKSPAKAAAARRNGRLGGRPPSTEKKAVS